MHKFFRYPKFSETLKGCPRNFSALWDQKISTEKCDTPFSSIKLFEPKNSKRHKNFDWKSWYAPSSINFFRYQKISGKQKGSFTKLLVSVLWDEKFRQNRDAPPPSYAWNFSIKEFSLKHQSVLQWNISVQWDKNFDGKSWYPPPPLMYKIFFLTGNFLKHRMVPWRSFFGPVR